MPRSASVAAAGRLARGFRSHCPCQRDWPVDPSPCRPPDSRMRPWSFLVTNWGPLMRGPSKSPQVGPSTVNVGTTAKTATPQTDTRISGRFSGAGILFFTGIDHKLGGATKPRIKSTMPELRLTKAEQAALVEKALREKARRQGANRKARADRIANGRRRIEKTVPASFLPEIRRLVASVLAELEAGNEPRLRRGDPVTSVQPSAPDVVEESRPTTAPPPGTPGLGPAGRRRAQAARRRARQRAAGKVRTTFDVPAELVNTVSKLVDRMVAWMSEGVEVILDLGQVRTGTVPTDRDPTEQVRAARPGGTHVARVLDDLVKPEGDPGEGSALFEDIQAVARLERKTSSVSTPIGPAQITKPRGDGNS